MKLLFVTLLCLLFTLRVFAGNCLFENSEYIKITHSVQFSQVPASELTLQDINWAMKSEYVGDTLTEVLEEMDYLETKVTYYKSLITGQKYVSVRGYPGDTLVIEFFEASSGELVAEVGDGEMTMCEVLVPGL